MGEFHFFWAGEKGPLLMIMCDLLDSREQYVKCTLEIFDILEFPVFLESFEKLSKQIGDQNELEMQFKWLSM